MALQDLESLMFTTETREDSISGGGSVPRPITCSACSFHNPSGAKKCMACESTLKAPPPLIVDEDDEDEPQVNINVHGASQPRPTHSVSSPRGYTRDRPSMEDANVDAIDEKQAAMISEAYEKMATKYRTPNLNLDAFKELIGLVNK
jgi:hypothetical protein